MKVNKFDLPALLFCFGIGDLEFTFEAPAISGESRLRVPERSEPKKQSCGIVTPQLSLTNETKG